MTIHHTSRSTRRGFTLIELLVVMAIIAILVSLLLAGVMAAFYARDRARTQYEIRQLEASLKEAMQTYRGVKTLPGKLVLYNNIDVYRNPGSYGITATTNPSLTDVARTKEALAKMFGSRFITHGSTVSWDGTTNTNAMILEGQQCLVFYLGGIADTSTGNVQMTGFSADPLNPTLPGGQRIVPFYEFPTTRLVGGFGAPAGFYNFIDSNKVPYAYFGGTGPANSYLDYCPSLGVSVYSEGAGKFSNPNSFQIIAAGKDKTFGPGGQWDPKSGVQQGPGRDDLSNFSTAVLGAGS